MIIDKHLYLSRTASSTSTPQEQAITASASTAVVMLDKIDLGPGFNATSQRDGLRDAFHAALANDIGEDGMLEFNCKITTAMTTSASAAGTFTIALRQKANTSSMASGTVVAQASFTSAAANPSEPAGTTMCRLRIPADVITLRYLGGTVLCNKKVTAGKVKMWIGQPSETPHDAR